MSDAAPAPSGPTSAKFDKTPFMLALTLTAFTTIAAALLAVGDTKTRPEIALRLAEDLNAILSQVVPAELHDNELSKDTLRIQNLQGKEITVYRARRENEIIGFAYPVTAQGGYSGPIELVMGVSAQGEVLGVRVLAHAETPGLGDKIDVQKDDWILGFNGLSFANLVPEKWAVKKDDGVFDQFSGATITPRAVVAGVKQGLDFYHTHQAELFTAPKPATTVEKGTPSDG